MLTKIEEYSKGKLNYYKDEEGCLYVEQSNRILPLHNNGDFRLTKTGLMGGHQFSPIFGKPYYCICKSNLLTVFYSNDYETSVRCINCNNEWVVHSG